MPAMVLSPDPQGSVLITLRRAGPVMGGGPEGHCGAQARNPETACNMQDTLTVLGT